MSRSPLLADDDDVTFEQVKLPVALSDGDTYNVAGYVFRPRQVRYRTVQLLIHGATYNHLYWDTPDLDGVRCSYAREMARRGYFVVAIDQLGAGASDKPNGDFFNLAEAASSVHQVAQAVRSWGAAGERSKLAFVGHSNGAVTAIYTQGTFADADALVITGWVHGFRPLPVDPTDPEIAASISTPYLAFRGPKRDVLMYFLPSADQAMVSFDGAHLTDSMPRQQFLDLIGVHADIFSGGPGHVTTLTRSQLVKVPVLVQIGEGDLRIAPPTSGPPAEQAFYPGSPDFTSAVLPAIGHCFNLHRNHRGGWDGIDAWIDAREGR